jgi:hypothetical protein
MLTGELQSDACENWHGRAYQGLLGKLEHIPASTSTISRSGNVTTHRLRIAKLPQVHFHKGHVDKWPMGRSWSSSVEPAKS